MDNVFRKVVDNNFSELAGLTVDASVPVPEHLVNELIAVSLRGNKNITYCRVTIGAQNRVSADVKTPLWPWPVNLKLRLFRSVDLTGSPKVRAFLENNVLLGKLGSLFKALPDWINIYQDQIVIDVGPFVQTSEQKRMLDLVRSIEISTEQAKVIFGIRIGVD
ncbi:MAG: hypothetical protein ABI621_11265 [Chloroflexota bacterium]